MRRIDQQSVYYRIFPVFFLILLSLNCIVFSIDGSLESNLPEPYFFEGFESESSPYDLWSPRDFQDGLDLGTLYVTSENPRSGDFSLHHNDSYTWLKKEFSPTPGIVEIWLYDNNIARMSGGSIHYVCGTDESRTAVGFVPGHHDNSYYAYTFYRKDGGYTEYFEIIERTQTWHNFTYTINSNGHLTCYLNGIKFHSDEEFGQLTGIYIAANGRSNEDPDVFYDDISFRELSTFSREPKSSSSELYLTTGFEIITGLLWLCVLPVLYSYKRRARKSSI